MGDLSHYNIDIKVDHISKMLEEGGTKVTWPKSSIMVKVEEVILDFQDIRRLGKHHVELISDQIRDVWVNKVQVTGGRVFVGEKVVKVTTNMFSKNLLVRNGDCLGPLEQEWIIWNVWCHPSYEKLSIFVPILELFNMSFFFSK